MMKWFYSAFVAIVTIAAVLFYSSWKNETIAHTKTKLEATNAALVSVQEAAAITEKLKKGKDEAIEKSAKMAQRNRADANSARTELERLRSTIAAHATEASADTNAATTDRVGTTSQLFGECATAITELAETADRLNTDRLTLLGAWPKQ